MTEKLFWHYLGSEARNGKPQRLLLYSPRREQDCQLLSQLKEDKAQEIQNEYWRLLYVAMTRARDRLYIGGYRSGNQTVREDCWYSACAEALRQLGTPAEPPLYLPHDLQTPQHVLVYATEHKAEVPKPKDIVSSHLLEEIKLPDYALTPAPEDPNPPRPLYPSQMNEDEEVHFPPVLEKKLWERGRIIHQLLQLLGDNKPQQSEKLIERFLSTQSEKLTAEEQEKIAQEVKVLLNHPDFGVVFQPEAASEVPIGGVITDANGQPRVLSGQIDRIYVSAEEIVLVDFKTNRNPPRRLEQAPVAYLRQMHAYARILKEVYPGRRIRAALLWTALPLWMEIPLE
jgi:ATP-dependent helicase/nuclease subunit A